MTSKTTNKTTNMFSPEVRARAVRMVLEQEKDYPSRWAAVVSIAEDRLCGANAARVREEVGGR